MDCPCSLCVRSFLLRESCHPKFLCHIFGPPSNRVKPSQVTMYMCAQWDETAGVQWVPSVTTMLPGPHPDPSHILSVPACTFFTLFPLLAMNVRLLSSFPTHHHPHPDLGWGLPFSTLTTFSSQQPHLIFCVYEGANFMYSIQVG